MMPGTNRERSGCELVFGVLKALMVGYRLWGHDSGVTLRELAEFLGAPDTRIGGVVGFLVGEGLVVVSLDEGVVRLTDQGAQALLAP